MQRAKKNHQEEKERETDTKSAKQLSCLQLIYRSSALLIIDDI